jgi:hypothetical protein
MPKTPPLATQSQLGLAAARASVERALRALNER